jgi:hypothetical protein
VLTSLCAPPALAEILRATFHRGSALVEESRELDTRPAAGGRRHVSFHLPGAADPQTLSVSLASPEAGIIDLSWEKDHDALPPAMDELRQRIRSMEEEVNTISSELEAAKVQVEFLESVPGAEILDPGGIQAASKAIAANLSGVLKRRFTLGRSLADKEEELARLRRELDDMGNQDFTWRVNMLLAPDAGDQVRAVYSYRAEGYGWNPLYRLEARPAQGQVKLGFQASVRQASGRDWSKVPLRLATLETSRSSQPPELPPWVLKPRPQLQPRAADSFMESAAMAPAKMEADTQPRVEQMVGYEVWDLGVRDLPAGEEQRLPVMDLTMPAEFDYLLRPSRSPEAFVRAMAGLEESRDLPSGQAVVLLEGAMLGKRAFSLAEDEAEIFFGTDALVNAETTLLDKKTGREGFIGKKRTYHWKWRIRVANHKQHQVDVRVEEPRPVARDERIKVETVFTPSPDETTEDTFVWNLQLPPGAERDIVWEVSVQSPSDMPLDTGWR